MKIGNRVHPNSSVEVPENLPRIGLTATNGGFVETAHEGVATSQTKIVAGASADKRHSDQSAARTTRKSNEP
jgi:hypothetical protein